MSLHAPNASSREIVFQPPRNSSNTKRHVLPTRGVSRPLASSRKASCLGREEPSTGSTRSAKREVKGLLASLSKKRLTSCEGASSSDCALRKATCLQTMPTDRKRL
eukprot:CAMPEP_0204586462 /NCGR_PEP_ID=MMETSP0661-20131031/47506_1 /ASSEMBLY_ACC=CAM_ASM_000606 /TAXON_ID=109239 /ORGANISM="Alexandrium margalefi, Strain AMGDE01CS-322" /LENGTH=105 /DNA_ID=CAMNT_0051596103 /DNA_START=149 /DNA_END=462 /DNA_ORIENTATION=-